MIQGKHIEFSTTDIFSFNIFHLSLYIKGQSMRGKKKEENAIAAKSSLKCEIHLILILMYCLGHQITILSSVS